MSDPFLDRYESVNKVPILTCFIPSLAAGTPFRISIHSWLKPTASTILRSRLAIDEEAAFEARVYLDGVHLRYDHGRSLKQWLTVLQQSHGPRRYSMARSHW